ncbi:MAG TPA: GDSL-type esterase/lipase family protein [Ktedonobacteraceae bacterium]|nr:GDSL-type esterase/lipase family protein [Ktedonobacteraceae bacterium]
MIKRLIRQRWFWGAVTLGAVAALLTAFLKKLLTLPPRIVAVHKKPGEKLVILFGDSITQGGMSANFVEKLACRMERGGYRFMNAGIDGDTAYNLLNRLQPIVESYPDDIVILVGTNELQAYLRGGHLSSFIQRQKKLPEAVTREWYIGTMRQLVLTLQNETNARIALCSIPPLGEDLDSLPNQRVRQFNQDIKALADELDVAYLLVYEIMEQYLRAHQQEPGPAFDEARAGKMMMKALRYYNIRGRSWEDISAHHGLLLQTDTIHFNSHGANIIADLIEDWLRVQPAELPAMAQAD